MKTIGLLSLLTLALGCSTEQVDSQEVKATITSFSIPVAACMGGYEIETPSGNYRINNLPPDSPYQYYEKLSYPVTVWVRYKKTTEGQCANFGSGIDITAIRPR